MELRDYLKILRERWMLITAVLLVTVAGAAALTISATPQYQSSAQLFVSTSESNTSDAYQGGLLSQQRVKSYVTLISGGEIARRVAEELGGDTKPDDIRPKLSATSQPDTVVMTISATDESPERAQELAQTTAEVFSEYVSELETPPGKTTAPVKASITDQASEPASPVSPRPLRNIALAVVLGLIAGFGLAALRDLLDNRIKTPSQLAALTGDAPALGHIPLDKHATSKPLISQIGTHAPRAEAYRVMRTNLQFVNVDSQSRIFVVTSSVPGEGKTMTSANLAVALSQAGHKTLLIGGDLRLPKLGDYFGVESAVGVTTVLLGRATLTEATHIINERLGILASGPVPPNPAELLQSESMRTLIQDASALYDYVIVDAPPLLPVTDAAILASHADGAMLVVRHGSTTEDQVAHSRERLATVGARMVGTVMNMTPAVRKGYGYGSYTYGYGSSPDVSTTDNPTVTAAAPKRRASTR